MKNVNPLHDIHQRLLHADKSHFPAQSDLKKIACLKYRKKHQFMERS